MIYTTTVRTINNLPNDLGFSFTLPNDLGLINKIVGEEMQSHWSIYVFSYYNLNNVVVI